MLEEQKKNLTPPERKINTIDENSNDQIDPNAEETIDDSLEERGEIEQGPTSTKSREGDEQGDERTKPSFGPEGSLPKMSDYSNEEKKEEGEGEEGAFTDAQSEQLKELMNGIDGDFESKDIIEKYNELDEQDKLTVVDYIEGSDRTDKESLLKKLGGETEEELSLIHI